MALLGKPRGDLRGRVVVVTGASSLTEVPPEEFRRVIEVNLLGVASHTATADRSGSDRGPYDRRGDPPTPGTVLDGTEPTGPRSSVDPSPDTAAALRRGTTCRYLPVYPTLEAAMARTNDETAPVQLSARLLPAAGAARQARELVTEACARWDVPQLIGPACTIVTELVNNVVVHARTPMEVMLRLRECHLNISVRDGSFTAPRARGPVSPTAPGGRGLMMVEAVAQRWGYTPVERGKVVWAVLRTDEVTAH